MALGLGTMMSEFVESRAAFDIGSMYQIRFYQTGECAIDSHLVYLAGQGRRDLNSIHRSRGVEKHAENRQSRSGFIEPGLLEH